MIIGISGKNTDQAAKHLADAHGLAPMEPSTLFILAKAFFTPNMFGDACVIVKTDDAADLVREVGTLIHLEPSLIPFSTGDMLVHATDKDQDAMEILDALVARARWDN